MHAVSVGGDGRVVHREALCAECADLIDNKTLIPDLRVTWIGYIGDRSWGGLQCCSSRIVNLLTDMFSICGFSREVVCDA